MVPPARASFRFWVCERGDQYGRDYRAGDSAFFGYPLWVAMGFHRHGMHWPDLAVFLAALVQTSARASCGFTCRVKTDPERSARADRKSSVAFDVCIQAGVGFRDRKISDRFDVVVLHDLVPEVPAFAI